ncbi:N-acetylmuramoyl-L-alanine amidase [Desulfitobacterium dichloroeliminans LMG P-21439]|uniref:N-acetylmuramoyl-L-alanine amidase n=1 Tax=Desulfitobacterium dichloroeliminans (strain LMG P-21439 / DCA1) TaxID=871963 RepID=L0F3S8_DESDL|nr:peptidoglycan recognition family protein [Desulfitobacterium dichloroeliminans]AGA67832.1 N-acetylmuramoyl-L-alanine amidase [Desulfitobacterium dichloroeliminans LMG P-21439]
MDWQKIVIHHSASPTSVKRGTTDVPVDAAMIRQWHLAKGWSDIGYHFVILPDGRCEEGRPLFKPGAHCVAGHRNFIGIGICLVGNFSLSDEIPEAQLNGLVTRVISLMQIYGLGIEDVELHREIPGAATECPGRFFPEDLFGRELRERLG